MMKKGEGGGEIENTSSAEITRNRSKTTHNGQEQFKKTRIYTFRQPSTLRKGRRRVMVTRKSGIARGGEKSSRCHCEQVSQIRRQ